ncbi:DUF2505 domain-containing protein [Granulicoccus phenolivorans]|uniref:DUF2505 domain-containing protein n=1 Tax=Granulicoccus phenolivorans TaxID=266854 RepID=UPI000419BF79|nr:DUF2505 domain-containing protein [Granulicoccus phenolivorans]
MEINARADFAAPTGAVFTMLTTEEYLRRVSAAAEATEAEESVSGAVTRTRRALPAPEPLHAVTGRTVTVTQVIDWGAPDQSGTHRGRIRITVEGQPARMEGTADLVPTPSGTTVRIRGDFEVKLPLFGRKVEQLCAPMISDAIGVEQSVGTQWLAEHPEGR